MSKSERCRRFYLVTSYVLRKLDQCDFEEFGGNIRDVVILKGILTFLPSIFSTLNRPTASTVRESVFGLRKLLSEQVHASLRPSWSDLFFPLARMAFIFIPDLWSVQPTFSITRESKFRHVRVLALSAMKCEKLPDIEVCNLRYLSLSHCPGLRLLSFGNGDDFGELRTLRIFKCPRLIYLPDFTDLLPRVKEIYIHNCALLDLSYYSWWNSLPALQLMELIGLPKLENLPGLLSARKLRYLTIGDCKSLRSIDTGLQHLRSLQELCVYNCPALSMTSNVFQSLPVLHSLEILGCPKVTPKFLEPFISHIPQITFDERDDGSTHMEVSHKSSVNFNGLVDEVNVVQIGQLVIQQKSPEVGGGGSSQVIAGYNTNGSGNQTNGDINIHTEVGKQQNVHVILNIHHQLNVPGNASKRSNSI